MGMDLNDHRDPIDYQVLGDLLMNFDWNMEKKPKRTRPNKRASKAPMKLNIADTGLLKAGMTKFNEIISALTLTLLVNLVTNMMKAPIAIVLFLALILANNVNTASLDETHKNFMYQHKGSALCGSETIVSVSSYSPCYLLEYLCDVRMAVQENKKL